MLESVKLIAVTQPLIKTEEDESQRNLTAEELIVYCARVSNPSNQDNHSTAPKLLKYCINHGHWSVFAQANMTIEIKTSRDISAQIIRHKSMDFQEFSQRYAPISTESLADIDFRMQGKSNRQVGESPLQEDFSEEVKEEVGSLMDHVSSVYNWLLARKVSRETARKVMPMNSPTVMYVNGTVRSWLHYAALRRKSDTQKEHRYIAESVWELLREHFPNVIEAYEQKEKEDAFKERLFGWHKNIKKKITRQDVELHGIFETLLEEEFKENDLW